MQRYTSIVTLLASLALAACGGGGSDSGAASGGSGPSGEPKGATASLGAVQNAEILLFRTDRLRFNDEQVDRADALLDSAFTGDDGIARDLDTGDYQGPVLAILRFDDNTEYFDEAAGTTFVIDDNSPRYMSFFPDNPERQFVMGALLPEPRERFAVTPLTSLAVQQARQESVIPPDADGIRRLNNAIRSALAPELTDILAPPTVFDGATGSQSLKDTQAGRHALRLAALAALGDHRAEPALATFNELARDLYDGTLGDEASQPVYADFISELRQALADMANDYGTPTLQDALAAYPAVTLSPDFVNGGDPVGTPGGMGGTVDGTDYQYDQVQVMRYEPDALIAVLVTNSAGTSGSAWGLTLKLTEGDTLTCDRQAEEVGLVFSGTGTDPAFAAPAPGGLGGASCDLSISARGESLEGTFQGTLVNEDGDSVQVSGGTFNLTLPDGPVTAGPGGLPGAN